MSTKEKAIEKIEGWARWEIGNDGGRTGDPASHRSPGFLPGDQADHLTVELALKEFQHARMGAEGLRRLLLHLYGHESFIESFDPTKGVEQPGAVQGFLASFGWRFDNFMHLCARRFVRFLAERL